MFHLTTPANRGTSLRNEQEGKRWGKIREGKASETQDCVTTGNEKYSQNYSIPCTFSQAISLNIKHSESPPVKETVSISWSERLSVEIDTNLVAATALLYVLQVHSNTALSFFNMYYTHKNHRIL